MKREIFIIVALVWAGPATAAETGHCDSKPFALKKPGATDAKPAAAVAADTPASKPAPAKPAPPKKAAQVNKSKYVIGCKQPKA